MSAEVILLLSAGFMVGYGAGKAERNYLPQPKYDWITLSTYLSLGVVLFVASKGA